MKRFFLALLFFSLAFTASTAAFADRATDAFNEGKRLMGKGQHAEACNQFAAAETAAGPNVKTRYWTGRCNEEQNKKAAAYLAYKDAKRMAEKAGDSKRAKVIDQRISELGTVLPFLVITVPPELEKVAGLKLARDGEDVPRAQWGEPFPVDIGKHEITVSAPGYKSVSLKVTATEPGSKAQLVLPPLTKEDTGGAAVQPLPNPNPPPVPPPSGGGAPDEPEMKRKNAGLFWTGVGLVSAGGIAVLAGVSLFIVGAGEDAVCFGECEDRTPGAIAALVIGGVFLGVGIPFMVVFGGKEPVVAETGNKPQNPQLGSVTVQPVVTPGGLVLQGTF